MWEKCIKQNNQNDWKLKTKKYSFFLNLISEKKRNENNFYVAWIKGTQFGFSLLFLIIFAFLK